MLDRFTSLVLVFLALSARAYGQHADIEFTYSDERISIGGDKYVFESDFLTSGAFEQFTDQPGFASRSTQGQGVNPGDIIDYDVVGPLTFHDGQGFNQLPSGVRIRIDDGFGNDWIVDGDLDRPTSGPGILQEADLNGDVHAHIDFELQPLALDSESYGAYGVLMELTTDASGVGSSEPFYIVFNFGLDQAAYDNAIASFATTIPEPSGWALCLTAYFLVVWCRGGKAIASKASALRGVNV